MCLLQNKVIKSQLLTCHGGLSCFRILAGDSNELAEKLIQVGLSQPLIFYISMLMLQKYPSANNIKYKIHVLGISGCGLH